MSKKYNNKEYEIQANTYTIKGLLYCEAGILLSWFFCIIGFYLVDKTIMTVSLVVSLLLLIFPLASAKIKGLDNPRLKIYCLMTVCIASSIIVAALSFHATLLYTLPLIFAVQYRNKLLFWLTYVVNIILMAISLVVGFYYGVCDLNVLFVTGKSKAYYVDDLTGIIQNLHFNQNPTQIILIYSAIPKAMILFLFAKMLQDIMNRSLKEAIKMAEFKIHKETDVVTKAYTKDKLEEMMDTYYPTIETIGVIFWDLNNLKEINDRYGHSRGDEAIRILASGIHSEVESNRRVYRFGGDEFIMIIDNPIEGETEGVIKTVSEKIGCYSIEDLKLVAAVGCSTGKGAEIQNLLNMADESMYANKRESKENA